MLRSVGFANACLVALSVCAPACGPRSPWSGSGRVLDAFPSAPDPEARHVVYLHGRIVEEQGPDAVSPEHGPYELDAILAALARPGTVVVGEVRGAESEPAAAAHHVAAGIRGLLAAGVPAARVTVVGASKGAAIAMLVATELDEPDLGYVLLGGCSDWAADHLPVAMHGRVLSIHEASDALAGSCEGAFARSPALRQRAEIRLDTGLGHGFLYRPLPAWVEPAVAWSLERDVARSR